MLGCGPREGALSYNTIIFSSLSLSLLSAIHRLMQSKQASMRKMGVRSISDVKGQIELSVVGVELDTKAVLSRDRRNGCRVNSEEDGPQHRTLGYSIVQWLGLRGGVMDPH